MDVVEFVKDADENAGVSEVFAVACPDKDVDKDPGKSLMTDDKDFDEPSEPYWFDDECDEFNVFECRE